jgi:hypothetical protein
MAQVLGLLRKLPPLLLPTPLLPPSSRNERNETLTGIFLQRFLSDEENYIKPSKNVLKNFITGFLKALKLDKSTLS